MPSFSTPRAARWLLLICCLTSSISILAQSTGGRILGRVTDPTGAVLGGVKITLLNQATNVGRSVNSNESGDFVFVEVELTAVQIPVHVGVRKEDLRWAALGDNLQHARLFQFFN